MFQYLSQCDTVCLLKDGRILESGTHAKLMSNGAEYAALISTYVEEEEQEEGQEGPPDTDLLLEVASSRSVHGQGSDQEGPTPTCSWRWPPHGQLRSHFRVLFPNLPYIGQFLCVARS